MKEFFRSEAASGLLLAACTVIALILANSAASDSYFHLLHTQALGLSLHHWINDGLMVIFFFVVGMEIKRELVVGELSNFRQAALPIAGAIGGMVVPALVYHWLNPNYPESPGWGIPMATDIAFAVGVLSFFGKRVPFALKIFLLALAIVDDLGAVLVIAFFYTQGIQLLYLALAGVGLAGLYALNRAKVTSYSVYIVIGVAVWFCVLRSGIHATIAGVLIGFLTPIRAGHKEPLKDLVHTLHPLVGFAIMPIFALANAGVNLGGVEFGSLFSSPIFQGVSLGLVLGKPLGIVGFAALAVTLKIAQVPRGIGWGDLTGVAFLGGIGFTMALFVSSLALYPELELFAKSGILLGSLAAMILGALLLSLTLKKAAT